jgi:hypothetical protein
MTLPRFNHVTFEIEIPSLRKSVRFRPWLVKEEKFLLIAQKSDDKDMIYSVKQVITNCCLEDIDVDSLTTFDVVLIFLRLRAVSVGKLVELAYEDKEDKQIYKFEVDLSTIDVKRHPEHETRFKIDKDIGVVMKYPDITMAMQLKDAADDVALFSGVLRYCIAQVYDEENVYDLTDQSDEEIDAMIDSMPLDGFEKIQKFFDTMPTVEHVLTYKNSLGHDRTIKLDSIRDFFTWD